MVLLLILGIIDVIAGGIIFFNQSLDITKYIGLILMWKGIITLIYYLKSKIKVKIW